MNSYEAQSIKITREFLWPDTTIPDSLTLGANFIHEYTLRAKCIPLTLIFVIHRRAEWTKR